MNETVESENKHKQNHRYVNMGIIFIICVLLSIFSFVLYALGVQSQSDEVVSPSVVAVKAWIVLLTSVIASVILLAGATVAFQREEYKLRFTIYIAIIFSIVVIMLLLFLFYLIGLLINLIIVGLLSGTLLLQKINNESG